MEGGKESRKSASKGFMAEGGGQCTVQHFAAGEARYAICCTRCGGLLVNEWYYGSSNAGANNIESLRCVQCGYRVDPVILQNQTRPPVERPLVRRGRRKSSAKAAVLSEVT